MVETRMPPIIIDGAYFEITDKCNFKCSYCCRDCDNEKEKFFPLSVYKRIIGELAQNKDLKMISISGGEAVLHPEFDEFVEYTLKHNIAVMLLTNGSLLKKIDANLLNNEKVSIQVSLDSGDGEINDATRGSGSFQFVKEGLQRCRDLGANMSNIHIKATLTRQNYLHLDSLVDFAKSMGIKQVGFACMYPMGRATQQLDSIMTSQDCLKAIKILERVRMQYPDVKIPPFGFTLLCPLLGDDNIVVEPKIDVNGKVYPCQAFEGLYDIGECINNTITEVFNGDKFAQFYLLMRSRNPFMDECHECVYQKKCKRGCPAISVLRGSPMSVDFSCDVRKYVFKQRFLLSYKQNAKNNFC